MNEDEYIPRRFTAALVAFKAHLARESPQTLRVLEDPNVGFAYTDALQFGFLSQDSDVFEQLTRAEAEILLLSRAVRANRARIDRLWKLAELDLKANKSQKKVEDDLDGSDVAALRHLLDFLRCKGVIPAEKMSACALTPAEHCTQAYEHHLREAPPG
jgi:hypothetical protein